ncbi:DEAD/DEAH box helicase, partial [Kitasatospora sp. NPDC058965]|uniref:DEAD/DEAH box helicase n=1 Tax=Kitasatospora sp. NPDC058965 TaxID=3346682 RepID=UPI0036C5003D
MNIPSRSAHEHVNSRSAEGPPSGGSSFHRVRPPGEPRPTGPRSRQIGRPPAESAGPSTTRAALPAAASFDELDMPKALLPILARNGVTAPFPIQAATLPNSLAGRDVLGRGRTGSGKTLAFGLAVLARTAGRRAQPRRPLALVLVPTRELAQQVTEALTPFAHAVQLRVAAAVGGMPINRQAQALNRGTEVLVATPGRLKDLIQRGDCRLDRVGVTVLDEADQMADMGFLPHVTEILGQVAEGGQTLLFSATLDRDVDGLVRAFLTDPFTYSADPTAAAVSTLEHHVLQVHQFDKTNTITHIASRDGRVIMFIETRNDADRLVEGLLANGVRAAALHSGKSQPQRTRTLEQFRTGQVTALIATNVAARGIHVDGLDLVVNLDPPADHKDYLHRGGRTARAGESGAVVTLVLPAQRRAMARLMAKAGVTPITTRVIAGDEELTRITGARVPTGLPTEVPDPVIERPRRHPSARRDGRGRPAAHGHGAGTGREGQGFRGRDQA